MRLGNYIILLFLTTIIFSIYPIVWHPCSDIVWGNSCFLNPIGGANVSEYLIVGNIFLVNNTSGDILAGIIKDIDNPAYYIDPSGNTKVNWLYVNYLGQNVNAYSNIIYGLKAVQFNPFTSRPVGIGVGALWRRDDGRLLWVDGSSGNDEILAYYTDIQNLNESLKMYISENYYNKSEVYNKSETDALLTNLNDSIKSWVQTNYYDKSTIDSWNLIKNYVLQQDLNANGFGISGVSSLGMSGDVVFNVPNATIHATQGLNIHLDKDYNGTYALNIQKSNRTIVTSIDEGGNIRTTGYVASNGESYAKATFPLAENTSYASHSKSTSQLIIGSSCSTYILKNLYLPAGQLSKTINGLVLFAIEGYVDVDCVGSGNMTFVIETPTGNSYSSQTYSLSSTASRFYSRIDIPKSDIVDGLYIVKLRLCSSAASLTGSTCTTTTYGKVLSAYLIVR